MKISIVIPNYDTWDLVKRNVDACLMEDHLISEIIITDDASPNNNPYNFPQKVKILRSEKNLNYTKNVNRGLMLAEGDIVVLLDSDAYPVDLFLGRLLELYKDKMIGCVGFKTVDEDGNDTGNFMYEPSIWGLYVGQQIHAKLKHLDSRKNKMIMPFSCAVSFSKECLKDLNYLDEDFEMLDADNDFSYRVNISNRWKLAYSDDITIYHKGGQSIPRNSKRVIKFYQSRWLFLKKFDKIRFKRLSRYIIVSRFFFEYLILNISCLFFDNERNRAKRDGRREIIFELSRTLK